MLEIIALVFLTKEIGKIAAGKGLKPGTWKIYAVLAWITGEFFGVIIGLLIFEKSNLFSIFMVALAGAITGYLILKNVLLKRQNIIDEDNP